MAAKARFLNPKTISPPPGYTHVVEVTGPVRTVYIAGQLGLDIEGKIVGEPGDFRAQAEQAFENVKYALTAVGASFADVVKLNNYLLDISHIGIFREVRDMFVNTANPPASTTLAIADFARPGALIEVEAVAVVPVEAPTRAAGAGKTGTRPAARPGRVKAKAAGPKRR
jgi:enamine deaminase RidA (YjgF/YER057c/UK114 family)